MIIALDNDAINFHNLIFFGYHAIWNHTHLYLNLHKCIKTMYLVYKQIGEQQDSQTNVFFFFKKEK